MKLKIRTFLAVQWLRIHSSIAEGTVLRFYAPCKHSQKINKKLKKLKFCYGQNESIMLAVKTVVSLIVKVNDGE